MLEFVILFHDMPPLAGRAKHWDLMLQDGEQLLTWALDRRPQIGHTIRGSQLPDHDIKYLRFEGEISGGRGQVYRVAAGTFVWLSGKNSDHWQIRMITGKEIWKVDCNKRQDQRFDFYFMPDCGNPAG